MRKANQASVHGLEVAYTFTDVNNELIENFTIESPYAGWLTHAKITVTYENFNERPAVGVMIGTSDDWGEINDANPVHRRIMDAWASQDVAASLMAHNIPKFFFLNDDSTERSVIEAKKNIYSIVEQGDNINVHIFWNRLGNTITSGIATIAITFGFSLAALDYKGQKPTRGSARGSEVAILATLDNNANLIKWTPPCNGRLANKRLTLYVEGGVEFNNHDYVMFGKQQFTDARIIADTIFTYTDGTMIVRPFDTNPSVDEDEFNAFTVYDRSMMFLKKGETVSILYNALTGTDAVILMEFDFIPDFDHNVDFVVQGNIENFTDVTDVKLRVFQIPFDMFLEDIKIDYRLSSTVAGDFRGTIYLMGIKDAPEILANITTILSGSLLGASGVMNAQSGVLPSNILEVLQINSENQHTDITPTKVHDYYPGGSFIFLVVDPETLANSPDLDFTYILNGKSRVKSSRVGSNHLRGEKIWSNEDAL